MVIECVLVEDGGAGDVDEDGVRLHAGQLPGADQAAGFAGERQSDDHDIGHGQHSVQANQRVHGVHRPGRLAAAGDRVNTRPECLEQGRGGLADAPAGLCTIGQ